MVGASEANSRSSRASIVVVEGGKISGASFCICGWGERSEPRPYIQRLARGALKGGLKVGDLKGWLQA